MKKTHVSLAVALTLAGLSVAANAEVLDGVTANIGVTSNYIWRGVSQTGNDASVGGGLDFSHDSGFYLSTWAGSLGGGTELDIYGGFSGEMAGGFGYDLGAIGYIYPNAADSDFYEIYASGSYSYFSAGINYTISGDAPAGAFTDGDIYYWGGASFDLPKDFSLGFTVGYYDFDDDGAPGVGDISYSHGQVDLTKSAGDFGDFTFTVSKAGKDSGDDDFLIAASWGKEF